MGGSGPHWDWTLETGDGFWNPLLWLLFMVFTGVLAYILWEFFFEDARMKRGLGTQPFISGNPELPRGRSHFGGSNVYWGFVEALKRYYEPLKEAHTGDVTDYVAWFLLGIALTGIAIFVW